MTNTNQQIMDHYAVMGNPIAHSRSPQIHQMFAEQTGENICYDRQQVDLNCFSKAAKAFFDNCGNGLNITVPFKLDAYNYADVLTDRAQSAGAVNTLAKLADGEIVGDNTDGVGLVCDITNNLQWPVKGKKVLLLGAGGAARGVLGPLLEQVPQHIVIANRTIDKALQLTKEFAGDGYLLGCGYDMLVGQQFDLVINATSASLTGDLPVLPDGLLLPDAKCYDMMYAATPTVFMSWATDHNAIAVADGLGMLVEQAAESFFLWRNKRPDTAPVIAAIRASLAA